MSIRRLFDLAGKKALVTGGSRGLGLQIAEALGEMGASVILASRKQAELDSAADRLRGQGVEASSIAFDVGAASDAGPLVDETLKRLGQVDILVNNAGATWGTPAEDYPLAAWDKVMNVNLRAVFLLSKAIAKRSMIPRRYGRIINISSIAGLGGNMPHRTKTVAYNTSKAAVINLTRTLAGEWGCHGITVNAIAPGWFPTKMTVATLREIGDDVLLTTPLRRFGDDEDLKGAVILFASDAGKHITGQTLAVDGGVSAMLP